MCQNCLSVALQTKYLVKAAMDLPVDLYITSAVAIPLAAQANPVTGFGSECAVGGPGLWLLPKLFGQSAFAAQTSPKVPVTYKC